MQNLHLCFRFLEPGAVRGQVSLAERGQAGARAQQAARASEAELAAGMQAALLSAAA